MKPRLYPAKLTPEDNEIWCLLDYSYAGKCDYIAACDADRRDAVLMYGFAMWRKHTAGLHRRIRLRHNSWAYVQFNYDELAETEL